jgi:hypothetical protein
MKENHSMGIFFLVKSLPVLDTTGTAVEFCLRSSFLIKCLNALWFGPGIENSSNKWARDAWSTELIRTKEHPPCVSVYEVWQATTKNKSHLPIRKGPKARPYFFLEKKLSRNTSSHQKRVCVCMILFSSENFTFPSRCLKGRQPVRIFSHSDFIDLA